jgi:hypothetical protein
MPILTTRALLLAKVETTSGVDSVPTPAANAIEVIEPSFSVDATVIERNFVRNDFSQYRTTVGRRLASITFSIEVRGSGTADTAPRWAALLEGCSFARSSIVAGTARTIATAPTGAVRASNITTFTTSATHGYVIGDIVVVTGVTDATFNGVFVVLSVPTTTTLTVANPGVNGNSGSGTMTYSVGVRLKPITDAPSTVTLYLYLEGLLHRVTGAMGTFTLNAEAGGIATMEFTFTGNYNEPTSSSYPTNAVFDSTLAPQVELAALTYGTSQQLVANALEIDFANEVVPRSDMNAANGYRNVRVTGRNPTGSFDPEVEVSHTFWNQMTSSTTSTFSVQFGLADGNRVVLAAPAVQITGIEYGDREGLRAYDMGIAFRRGPVGDDELIFFFD